MTKADAGKKAPAMPVFWFQWCVFDMKMAVKYLSHLPKCVPGFMIVFGTAIGRSHRYTRAYQVYKSRKLFFFFLHFAIPFT